MSSRCAAAHPGHAVDRASAQLVQVVDLLAAPEVRLVSVVGAGGIGKTRLALAAAAHWQQHTLISVHFVALENVPRAEGWCRR